MKNLIIFVSSFVLLCVGGTQSYTTEVVCPGEHEYFDCSVECDNVCSELHIQNKTNCPIVNIQCNRKCYCKDGYARDDKGICVPIEKCPENKKCPINEEYKTCKRTCPPETCISIVARFKCPGSPVCEPGCGCKDGFLRIKDGEPCVPICQCPQLTNSPDCN